MNYPNRSNPLPSILIAAALIVLSLVALASADDWVFSERPGLGFVITEYQAATKPRAARRAFQDESGSAGNRPSARTDARSVVIVWGDPVTCPPCADDQAEIMALGAARLAALPFRFEFRSDTPAWFTVTPTFNWEREKGKWVSMSGDNWQGVAAFKVRWEKSRRKRSSIERGIAKAVQRAWSMEPPSELVPSVKIPPPASYARAQYPIRGSWWTGCGSWRHMLTGTHAGKYDPQWLASLSWAALQSLHSDCHENRVNWAAVRDGELALEIAMDRKVAKPTARQNSTQVPDQRVSNSYKFVQPQRQRGRRSRGCPVGGGCP